MKFQFIFICVLALLVCGCSAPSARLTFPHSPIESSPNVEWFNVSGHKDFAIKYANGQVDQLLYDDDGDGRADRIYRLADYSNDEVPHVILLLDSIPFQTMKERFDSGDFRWFGEPQKMIAPFPSLTEICYSDVLHAPPLPGEIDQFYDPRIHKRNDQFWRRVFGHMEPWERRCDYSASFLDQGVSFLDPRPWYAAELEMAHRAIDASPNKITIVYIASASSMVCKYGKIGAEEVLDGARQLCLQLLYERHGAVKITMLADHGHNYVPSTNVSLDKLLRAGGFHAAERIEHDDDVILEINGLVTCAGLLTRRPKEVANLLVKNESVELAMYMDQDRAIVCSAAGSAAIDCQDGQLRYRPIDADVLQLGGLANRFIDDATWFNQTLDHAFPNGPRRIWDALHRQVVNPPTVYLTMRDGFCAGLPAYEKFIKMQSTHGGLNQINSATFIMTMTGRLPHAIRHQDVFPAIAPGFEPRVVR